MTSSDLVGRLADPGFTPSVRGVGDLLDLLQADDDALAKSAERAVLRIETQYAPRVAAELLTRVKIAERPARGRLTHLAGRLVQNARDPEGTLVQWLVEALADPDQKTRRAAARALGKAKPTEAIETALSDALDRASGSGTAPTGSNKAVDNDKRALAFALGKVGGEAARSRLAGAEHGRASIIVDRDLARRTPGAIALSQVQDRPLPIWFHTRSGLEDVLKEELGSAFGTPRFVAPGVVEAQLEGALSSATKIRTATHVGFPLVPVPGVDGRDLAADIVRAIGSPSALGILRALTVRDEGAPIRFRLAFARGGHRRSIVWRCAELVRKELTDLVNDPKESTWEVVIDEVGGQMKIELVPRGYVDERFRYREDLVPASSHPAIAAALARVAPRTDDDIVWDPFAGAGMELVERAFLGPYRQLIGTDVDPKAVAAARSNLRRAGVDDRTTIEEANACEYAPRNVNVIVTNPPMGRRVERGSHVGLLDRFVQQAARVLVPGGALVWLVPEPGRIRERADAAGLELKHAFAVDMSGFSAELSVYVKRKPQREPRKSSPKNARRRSPRG